MKRACILMTAILLALLLPLASSADEIRVGLLLPLTGKMSRIGVIEEKAFLLAAEEINQRGGARGMKIKTLVVDTQGVPETAVQSAKKLMERDKVSILCGCCSSSVAFSLGPVVQEAGVPLLVATAASDRITESGWSCVFRLCNPAGRFNRALISFFRRAARVRTVSVLQEDSPFGIFYWDLFREVIKKSGLELVLRRTFSHESHDLKEDIRYVDDAGADLLYVIGRKNAVGIAEGLTYTPRMLLMSPSTCREWGDDGSEPTAAAACDHVFMQCNWSPSLAYRGASSFYRKFKETYYEPPDYHAAQAYSAMQVIADALERSNLPLPENLRLALSKTEIETVMGPVRFGSYGKMNQQNLFPSLLCQRLHGNLEVIWPRSLATASYVMNSKQ